MSCADVCLDTGWDCDNEFYAEALRTARKHHRCCECRETIPVGARYERASGKSDGDVWSVASCLSCREIRRAFTCGSWCFGDLWPSIYERIFPVWTERGPIDCLAKVESRAARDKLRAAYAAWQREMVE